MWTCSRFMTVSGGERRLNWGPLLERIVTEHRSYTFGGALGAHGTTLSLNNTLSRARHLAGMGRSGYGAFCSKPNLRQKTVYGRLLWLELGGHGQQDISHLTDFFSFLSRMSRHIFYSFLSHVILLKYGFSVASAPSSCCFLCFYLLTYIYG